jgi:hypothetical protein
MKSKYAYVYNMLLAVGMLGISLWAQSCGCRQFSCPDIPPRTDDAIEIFFSQDSLSGDGFFSGELSNLMLIKLAKTTEAEQLDTLMPGPNVRIVTSVVIGPATFGDGDDWVNFDYLIKNIAPVVNATLADIQVSGEFDDSDCCTVYINKTKQYNFDGQLINNPGYRPLILR